MSKRRDVEGHITSLKDIHSIMESMKNIAMMETRKLDRYQKMQQGVVSSISHALNDVLVVGPWLYVVQENSDLKIFSLPKKITLTVL